jgi:hypothetical protein
LLSIWLHSNGITRWHTLPIRVGRKQPQRHGRDL